MGTLTAALIAALTQALLAVAAKILNESFFQSVLEKIIIAALERAAKMTTNSVDDELVAEVKKRLAAAPGSA